MADPTGESKSEALRLNFDHGISLLDLPIMQNVDLPVNVADFGRLAVAWGLSYLPNEIGDILPPSAIDDVPGPKPKDLTDRFVSKDLV